jgi:hypothetical protein
MAIMYRFAPAFPVSTRPDARIDAEQLLHVRNLDQQAEPVPAVLLRHGRDLLECPAGRAIVGAHLREPGQRPCAVVPRGNTEEAQSVRQ